MSERVSTRALGRATLARQLLLERTDREVLDVVDVVDHLVGLQAQTPHTWYVGLWSRIADVTPEEISALLEQRALVRIALMRSTIHLVSSRDALALRPVLQPTMVRAMQSNFGKNLVGVDVDELVTAGRAVLDDEPLIFSELGRRLAPRWPDRDPMSLAQGVRAHVGLAQVTPRGLWGRSGKAAHAPLESWLGAELTNDLTVDDLVRRYLGAFGPATVRDAQVWSGLTRLAEVFDRLRPELVVLTDDDGRELFDLADAPRPGPDVDAPARLLYDFDNLFLSHADRSRVVTDDYRPIAARFGRNGLQPRAVLVDGFTRGHWTAETSKAGAVVTVTPAAKRLSKADHAAVESEAQALGRFLGADDVTVEFTSPD